MVKSTFINISVFTIISVYGNLAPNINGFLSFIISSVISMEDPFGAYFVLIFLLIHQKNYF